MVAPNVFVSYRRADSAGHAGRLHDHLVARFGPERVFIDVESIEPGVDFVEALHRALQRCDTVVALIGPRWLNAADSRGQRRLDAPSDFVRVELETALKLGVPVIPVLVQGARMPDETELPPALAALSRRQAFVLSDHRWGTDAASLLSLLDDPRPAVASHAASRGLEGAGAALPSQWPPPLPAPLLATNGFVARSAELAAFDEVARKSAAGERQCVLVSGEPGIGKTRLVGEISKRLYDDGAIVLFGRCDEEVRPPYLPFVEAIGHVIECARTSQLNDWTNGEAGGLARLVPHLASRVHQLNEPLPRDPDTERLLMFRAVDRFLSKASLDQPIVVVLDDLHWADQATLLLLRHLVLSTSSAALLFVGTYRDNELRSSDPLTRLLGELSRGHLGTRLNLEGLQETDTAELITARLGRDGGMRLCRGLFRETDGNPFFVEEMLTHLRETGLLTEDATAQLAVGEVGLPEGIRETIGQRLRRLSSETQELLRAAAVVGREFDIDVVAAAADCSDADLIDALEEAVSARLVDEVADRADRFSFAHALIRETLRADLTNSRRLRLHRRIGRALEVRQQDSNYGELAFHLLEGGDRADAERVIDYAARAGSAALGLLAYEEAAADFNLALRALDSSLEEEDSGASKRAELLLSIGDAHHRGGNLDESRDAFRRAAAIAAASGDGQQLSRAAIGFTEVPLAQERSLVDAEAVGMLLEALQRIGPADSIERATLLYRLAREKYMERSNELVDLATEAAAVAARLGGQQGRLVELEAQIGVLWRSGQAERRLVLGNELLRLANEAGDLQRVWWARINRAVQSAILGDIDAVEAEGAAFAEQAEELHRPEWLWYPALWKAMRALLDGRLDDAEALSNEALAVGQQTHGDAAMGMYAMQLYRLRDLQGRLAELEAPLEALLAVSEDEPLTRVALAGIYASSGRVAEACAECDRFAAAEFAAVRNDVHWPVVAAFLARVFLWTGRSNDARVVYDRLLPFRGQCLLAGLAAEVAGSVDLALGNLARVLGQSDAAEAHYANALRMNRRIGAWPAVAEVENAWAGMLVARNEGADTERAHLMLDDAVAVSERLGLEPLRAAAERELATSGLGQSLN